MQILIEETKIQEAVSQLATSIARDHRDRPLTILGVLTGSIVLLSDLIRKLDMPLRVGLIQASSYRGATTTRGKLHVNTGLVPDIEGRDIVLIDDIFDTGHTLARLTNEVRGLNPSSLKSAVLLWKDGRQEVELTPDYHCFKIPDRFVVGYGLDYDDDFRHLPYIASLEESDLKN